MIADGGINITDDVDNSSIIITMLMMTMTS